MYICPGITIDIYWSAAAKLHKIHIRTFEVTIEPLLLKCFKTVSIIVSIQPIDFIAPPNAKAHITSEIVSIMKSIPPLFNNLSTIAFPVSILGPSYNATSIVCKSTPW